ncbi:hypothetical protein B0H19DRAFT_1193140 [Mycena capillaripes]|nr:hypothetical protein B0H19DRAFT_1193140 [Mycena capillaripes]
MIAVVALFLSPDIQRMAHHAQKRILTRRVIKMGFIFPSSKYSSMEGNRLIN